MLQNIRANRAYEEGKMADAKARRAAIKQASYQVRTGNAFVRRATAVKVPASTKTQPATKKNARH